MLTPQNFAAQWPAIELYWNAGLNHPYLDGGILEDGATTPLATATPHYCFSQNYVIFAFLNAAGQPFPLGPRRINIPGLMVGIDPTINDVYPCLLVCAPNFRPWVALPPTGKFLGHDAKALRDNMNILPFPGWLRNMDLAAILGGALPAPAPATPFTLPFASPFLLRRMGLEVKS